MTPKKKQRFAVGEKVLITTPGIVGVVMHVDDEPSVLDEYLHEIETEHGERLELGCSLELVPVAETNSGTRPDAAITYITIGEMYNSAFMHGSPGGSIKSDV
jgi:hypothetical protein